MKIFWCFIVGCVIGLIVTAIVKCDDSDTDTNVSG